MLVVATSPDVIAPINVPDPALVQTLIQICKAHPVGVISNKSEPAWFQSSFANTDVTFVKAGARQNGAIISSVVATASCAPYDVLVLAGKLEDIQMGKNGGAVLVAAGWSSNQRVRDLGIQVLNASELAQVVDLSSQWPGSWWCTGQQSHYSIRALSDLSSYGSSFTQQQFSQKVIRTIKNGGPRLMALLTVTARSILTEPVGSAKNLLWGIYPSSNSSNDDSEVLSDLTHRLRTTVSRVRYAKRDEPLFIRHTHSQKRSSGGSTNRTDPANQIETLHLNPTYRRPLSGRNVIVIDDCTTYGVSFGVAAAFLRKAGAASMTGVALGKFGNQLRYYEIDIDTDPFAPVQAGDYRVKTEHLFPFGSNVIAQNTLRNLIV